MTAAEEWLRQLLERLRAWRDCPPGSSEAEAVRRSLAELGLNEADLADARRGSDADIRRMMARFGIDPADVPAGFLAALRDAERICSHCLEAGRCRRFLAQPEPDDAARLFCPNAELFDRIAAAIRTRKA